MTIPDDLACRVRAWIAGDPDPATRAELEELCRRGARGELAARFEEPLRFGTAGLRGMLGAGPARMNAAVIRMAAAALGEYVKERAREGAREVCVVGHDARHGSARLADDATRVLRGAGVEVWRLQGTVPTPLLAFAVGHLGCAAGVMITASHNPASENGFKVYLEGGIQIASPLDGQVAAAMQEAWPASAIPLGDEGTAVGAELIDAYVDAVAALPSCRRAADSPAVRVLYTPLHGVGAELLVRTLRQTGREAPEVLASQAAPDPDFPSAPRPNPEESAALAFVLARAAEGSYDLVLAHDPDADRLAVALPSGDAPGGWRVLTGDEIAALLCEHVLARTSQVELADGVLVSTVASATLLAELAATAGVEHAQTLPGFKWVMRAGAGKNPARRVLFGYEEALGFFVGQIACDKDGIAAAVAMVACAEDAGRQGVTLLERLDRLALRCGLHATRLVTVELAAGGAPARAAREIMQALRVAPPRTLGGEAVEWAEDLLSAGAAGVGTRADKERVAGLPAADLLIYGTAENSRLVIRPSGTEPRIKIHMQARVQAPNGDVGSARRLATVRLDALEADMRQLLGAAARGRPRC